MGRVGGKALAPGNINMTDRITYTVTTTAGSRKHEVGGLDENLSIVRSIGEAFSGDRPGFLLVNPTTFYALANIISVGVEGMLPQVVEEARRSMGQTSNNDK